MDIASEAPEEDIIDESLLKLIEEIIGEDGDIEEFDAASDIVMDVIEELADQGVIVDIPHWDVQVEEKQKWLDQYWELVREKILMALNDDSQGDQ